MMVINEALQKMADGTMTAEQVIAEFDSYTVKYFSPSSPAEFEQLLIVRALVKKNESEKPAPKTAQIAMVKCSCGHTVPALQKMSTSTGSACPDCYDRMSN